MASNVTEFLRNKWKLAFSFFDVNGDGDLSEEDFVEIAHQMCRTTGVSNELVTKAEVEWIKLFRYLQKEPPVRLNEKGFIAACEELYKDIENHKKRLTVSASEMFDRLDNDNSGTISLDEFAVFYQAVGISSTDRIEDTFKNIDINGDGSIQREEFVDDFVRHFTDSSPATGVSYLLSVDKK